MEADTTYTCDNTYEVTRTFTATDACGNAATGQQVINIQDTTQPVFVEALPADTVVECSSVPAAAVLTATDNCAIVEVMFEEVETDVEDGCAQTYMLTRIWTVADACGNTNSHTQTVEVVDTTSPTFMDIGGLMNEEVVSVPYDDAYGNVTLPEIVSPSASDNCQEAEPCDSAATAEANAMLTEVLGLEDNIAYLSNVEATGLNNPFLTGGAFTTGVLTTPEVMAGWTNVRQQPCCPWRAPLQLRWWRILHDGHRNGHVERRWHGARLDGGADGRRCRCCVGGERVLREPDDVG